MLDIKTIIIIFLISLVTSIIFSGSADENIYYDDLRFPAVDLTKAGVNDPTMSNFVGNTRTYFFSNSKDEELFLIAQMPHSRLVGSDIFPHFHSSIINSLGNNTFVTWCLEYAWSNIDNDFNNFSNNICVNQTLKGIPYYHYITPIKIIDGKNFTESSILMGRIYRDVSQDNFTGSIALLEFDIHYYSIFYGEVASFN